MLHEDGAAVQTDIAGLVQLATSADLAASTGAALRCIQQLSSQTMPVDLAGMSSISAMQFPMHCQHGPLRPSLMSWAKWQQLLNSMTQSITSTHTKTYLTQYNL